MRFLALDIGTRKTGIAFLDEDTAVPLPLDTFYHDTQEQLLSHVLALVDERSIDKLLIGLPLLPSGDEGAQAAFVRGIASQLAHKIPVTFVDERYSTPPSRSSKHDVHPSHFDGDAAAACSLFEKARLLR